MSKTFKVNLPSSLALRGMQLLEEVVGPFPTSDTSAREAVWIYERVFGSQALYRRPEFDKIAKMEKEEIVRQIDNVLHLIHEEKLEVCSYPLEVACSFLANSSLLAEGTPSQLTL